MIDWIDEELNKLFNASLNEHGWKYMKKVAVESDLIGAKDIGHINAK